MSSDYAAMGALRLEPQSISSQHARRHPLAAFTLLEGGDVFERGGVGASSAGRARAVRWLERSVELHANGADEVLLERVRADMVRQLSGNPTLVARMESARPLRVDLVPPGQPLSRYGFPRGLPASVSGLFWDRPDWKVARMALRQEHLAEDGHLVFHELAHAIYFLAFSAEERALIHRLQLPVYRSRRAVDEVFAIYSEREFIPAFRESDLRAPGIYGLARARWDLRHVFTRFVRHLYHPDRPLPGAGFATGDSGWLG